jgi:hypothetical protein
MLRKARFIITLLVALRFINAAATYACAAESAADAFRGRGYTVQTDKAGRITSLKAASKAEPFTDADFARLKDESQLATVELSGDFTAAGVATLSGKTTIETLILGSPALGDDAGPTIATLVGLKDLRLFGNLTPEWSRPLAGKLSQLESLTVNGRAPDGRFTFPPDTDAAFRELPTFPKLRAFNPRQHHIYYINNAVVATLAKCTDLRVLNMGGSTWGGDKTTVDYGPLLSCKKLDTFVQFHASLYHDPTCRVLSQLPEMKKIVIDFVTDEGVKELAKLPKLETLQLGDSLVGPEGIQALAGCRSLRRLEITGPYSHAILDSLKEMKQLTSLTWTACTGGAEAESALRAALPEVKIVLTDRNGVRASAAGLREAQQKSESRLKSQRQLQPFLRAVAAYQAAYPLSEK